MSLTQSERQARYLEAMQIAWSEYERERSLASDAYAMAMRCVRERRERIEHEAAVAHENAIKEIRVEYAETRDRARVIYDSLHSHAVEKYRVASDGAFKIAFFNPMGEPSDSKEDPRD